MEIDELLKLMVNEGASDLHLTVPSPPVLRIDGSLIPQVDLPLLTAEDIDIVLEQVTTQEQKSLFDREWELDFAYTVPGLARFRVNALRQRGVISIAFRFVPFYIPSIDEWGLPQIFKELILKPRGLILVTGPSGSGKSTTLAAMLSYLNDTTTRNVITVEDPIEFIFRNKKCLIRQRDLGDDTKSFSSAVIHALRHDADVIVIGEMRDLATISTAIMAAETGHLVLGTLHTIDAPQSIDRMIDIRRLIRDEKLYDIHPNMEMGRLEGAQTMDQALAELVKNNLVTTEEALLRSSNPTKLQQSLQTQGKTNRFQEAA
jgi:twitching motility protein PilT